MKSITIYNIEDYCPFQLLLVEVRKGMEIRPKLCNLIAANLKWRIN